MRFWRSQIAHRGYRLVCFYFAKVKVLDEVCGCIRNKRRYGFVNDEGTYPCVTRPRTRKRALMTPGGPVDLVISIFCANDVGDGARTTFAACLRKVDMVV